MNNPVTPEARQKMLDLFLEGCTVNSIVRLLNCQWHADVVNAVLRERIKELAGVE